MVQWKGYMAQHRGLWYKFCCASSFIALCIGFSSNSAHGDESVEATRYALKAAYIQSGLKIRTKELKKLYIDETIGKDKQLIVSNIYFLIRTINTKQLSYGWEF
jgi:hypothetical protein